jgi:hypothetical protein
MFFFMRGVPMAAIGKLQRSDADLGQRLLWAVHVGQIEIVWQDRGDAANGRSEPKLRDAAIRPIV